MHTGRNATEDFDNVGHSEDAVKMMEQYYVGELEGGYTPPPSKVRAAPSTSSSSVCLTIFIYFVFLPISLVL